MTAEYKPIHGPVYKDYVEEEDYVASFSMFDINNNPLPPVDVMVFNYDKEQIVAARYGPNPTDDIEIGSIYEALCPTDSPEVKVIAEIILKLGEVRWRRWGDKGE